MENSPRSIHRIDLKSIKKHTKATHSLPRIKEFQTNTCKFQEKIVPMTKFHEVSNSVDHLKTERSMNISLMRLPALLPNLQKAVNFPDSQKINKNDEVFKLDKFVINKLKKPDFSYLHLDKIQRILTDENLNNVKKKSIFSPRINRCSFSDHEKPEFSDPNFDEKLKNVKKKSIFSAGINHCPFSNPELLKGFIKHPFNLDSPSLKDKNDPDKKALEKVWELFSSTVFSDVIHDFEQKVLKVPQLAKYFKTTDINKTFQGKLDFFKRNIGKRDMSMHNRMFLENIHKNMKIPADDFNVFKGFFSIVMREHMIEEDLIADFLIFLENFRKDIVSEPNIFQKAYNEILDFENILIEKFRNHINNNQLLYHYFANKDIAFQKNHCKAVINYLLKEKLGGYDQKLRDLHKDCVIGDHNFYYFKQCFQQSLKEFQSEQLIVLKNDSGKKPYFSQSDIYEIGDLIEEVRVPVINQKSYYDIFSEKHIFSDVIDFFLENINKKPFLKELFSKYSDEKVKRHAELLIKFVLGGPTKYSKCDITPAHYNLKITLDHYEEIRTILEETLKNFKVETRDRVYILSLLDSSKYDICNVKPLLQRMGGLKTIAYIINCLYLKVYQNPNLSGYFKNTDIKSMIQNQKIWFSKFFENAEIKPYHFKDLRTFHLGMNITEENFNFFIKNMNEGLKEFGQIDEEVIKEAEAWLRRTKYDILNLQNE